MSDTRTRARFMQPRADDPKHSMFNDEFRQRYQSNGEPLFTLSKPISLEETALIAVSLQRSIERATMANSPLQVKRYRACFDRLCGGERKSGFRFLTDAERARYEREGAL